MEKILISACFLGNPVRYDGTALDVASKAGLAAQSIIDTWKKQGRLVSICPEVAGGLPTPRPAAEIHQIGQANRIITGSGLDVTNEFIRGAELALNLCQQQNIKIAVLTESSPSCGSSSIYNGEFENVKIPGEGVTTALLRKHGIKVFSQFDLAATQIYLTDLEMSNEYSIKR